MSKKILFIFGILCSQISFAATTESSAPQAKEQSVSEKFSATFGEDTIFFSNRSAQEQFVKMTKKHRAYQQYAEMISINLMETLKETRNELGKIRDAATNDKVCDTKRAASYLTKLKNQMEDMFEASANMRKAYNHVSQVEIAVSSMSLSSDDNGERSRYWEECKDAFNNCIDAIKDARNDVEQKRDEYFTQITNIVEIKK